jgi:hypothetical protein
MTIKASSEIHPAEKLKERTKRLAIRVIQLHRKLPEVREAQIIGG